MQRAINVLVSACGPEDAALAARFHGAIVDGETGAAQVVQLSKVLCSTTLQLHRQDVFATETVQNGFLLPLAEHATSADAAMWLTRAVHYVSAPPAISKSRPVIHYLRLTIIPGAECDGLARPAFVELKQTLESQPCFENAARLAEASWTVRDRILGENEYLSALLSMPAQLAERVKPPPNFVMKGTGLRLHIRGFVVSAERSEDPVTAEAREARRRKKSPETGTLPTLTWPTLDPRKKDPRFPQARGAKSATAASRLRSALASAPSDRSRDRDSRMGKTLCKFFQTLEGCKRGSDCKYKHSGSGGGA